MRDLKVGEAVSAKVPRWEWAWDVGRTAGRAVWFVQSELKSVLLQDTGHSSAWGVDGAGRRREPTHHITRAWPPQGSQLPFKISLSFSCLLIQSWHATVCSLLNPGYSSKAAKVEKNLGQPVLYHSPKLGTNNLRDKNHAYWHEACQLVENLLWAKVLGNPAGHPNNPYSQQRRGRKFIFLSWDFTPNVRPA